MSLYVINVLWEISISGQIKVTWTLQIKQVYKVSAISRTILKPVYQFGIPNSNPQMLKSVDFWCKLLSTFLVAEPRQQCFELFKTQNSQTFPGFHPWTPLGRACSATPDSPTAQPFFSLLCSSKNWHDQKIAGYSTEGSSKRWSLWVCKKYIDVLVRIVLNPFNVNEELYAFA